MPCFLASLFSHSIARSSRWLSVGWATALVCAVVSAVAPLGYVDRLGPRGGDQRFGKQEFELFRADAPAPDRHLGASSGSLGWKYVSPQELEVGVLDPLHADLFV